MREHTPERDERMIKLFRAGTEYWECQIDPLEKLFAKLGIEECDDALAFFFGFFTTSLASLATQFDLEPTFRMLDGVKELVAEGHDELMAAVQEMEKDS